MSRLASRTPVRYYFIDLSNSCSVSSGRTLEPVDSVSSQLPESSNAAPCDPFKADVFSLGTVLTRHLYLVSKLLKQRRRCLLIWRTIQAYYNVEFLKPLVLSLTQRSPDARPEAAEALAHWRHIRETIPCSRRRLRRRNEDAVEAVVFDIFAAFRLALFKFQQFLSGAARCICRRFCMVLVGY